MTSASETLYLFTAAAEDAGERLDRFLAGRQGEMSRARIKALIAAGGVSSAGETIAEPAHRVKPGGVYQFRVPPAAPAAPAAQAITLSVLFEDEHLIVVDKPAGMVVHPAPGNPDRTLVNALLHHCGASLSGIGGVRRPGIVHRIDKDTSGLIVAAKNDLAHAGLARQFAAHDLARAYSALVLGVPSPLSGEVEGNIGRDPRNRKRMALVARGGKSALTRYKVLEAFGTFASLLDCRLATGRTHQIRVHLTHLGHPLLGDPVYGSAQRRPGRAARAAFPEGAGILLQSFRRQALHARLLGFRHPVTGKVLSFESPLPDDMRRLAEALRG